MIVSVGEVVWDIFPDGKQVLGGAPVNVAYHLSRLGLETRVITAVGDDKLGALTLQTLSDLGLSLEGIQKSDLPTGRVNISFDARNEPRFDIVAPAAWDAIGIEEASQVVEGRRFDLVFGTLAQRDSRSRRVIRTLWEKAERNFYDVNLRPPDTSGDLVHDSLSVADLVKLNGNELMKMAEWFSFSADDRKGVGRQLVERFGLTALVVTEGSKGAWVIGPGDVFYEDAGQKIEVADTVGAGDSFFAAIIEGYIKKRSWPECLRQANRRGAYVASRKGATPPMPDVV